jgi:hypothetical protein
MKTDLAIFRPSNGQWWISKSTGGTFTLTWGMSGDVPVSGDFDGDGFADFTIYRDGVWYTKFGDSGVAFVAWGIAGDRPAGRAPGT